MNKQLTHILLFGGLLFLFGSIAFAQDVTQSRSITSDDFIKQRPVNKKARPTSNRKTYKFVRQDKNIVRRKKTAPVKPKPIPQPIPPTKSQKVSEVGVTMWKLRPPRSSDTGHKLPVQVNDLREMWTAERVNPDTVFRAGDRVRLAVESSDSGYLYIINSEIYSDGTFGAPSLIFPDLTDEDNSVQPGLLVDIPDQTEDLPYFVITPKKDNYVGELLTVIISPKPIQNLKTDEDGKIINLDELIELEISADAEIYSRNDAQDKIYTPAEAQAVCGSKKRQLTRERSTVNPCGTKTRQLTRQEPLPQTIYRVKTPAGQPAVAFIKLNVK